MLQGWKILWYFRKYRKYQIFPIFLTFFIFSVYIFSICMYIAKIIWNLLPNNSMCVCALHIRWSTLVIHTALLWRGAIWQKLSNTEKMLRTQVISQQNTHFTRSTQHCISYPPAVSWCRRDEQGSWVRWMDAHWGHWIAGGRCLESVGEVGPVADWSPHCTACHRIGPWTPAECQPRIGMN